ncbi:hypothetical protein ES705_07554 [subsurface metagenome]
MIKIIVEIEKQKSELKIEGIGKELLTKEIIPSIKGGTPGLEKANQAKVLISLLSDMLKSFVRQKATLWEDKE